MIVSRNALWGSLLLLPATVLLWVFTYQPILTTLINSFYSTPRGRRPSVFIGADHYARLLADPVFWKAMTNNMIYAAVTIPLSIVLALVMAFAGIELIRTAYQEAIDRRYRFYSYGDAMLIR